MTQTKKKFEIPAEITKITQKLEKAGFESYLIGGCVRALLFGQKPKDWDITTNAKPEEIVGLFEKTFYENEYGTVAVVNEDVSDETLKVVEITPYRLEAKYTDKRRPDAVTFSQNLEDDLKRRDFTMNAIAYSVSKGQLIDLYKGQEDITDKLLRAIGDADDRFSEDALRMLRAVRFATLLDLKIEKKTEEAIVKNSKLLEKISSERIRDEFSKIIMSDEPMKGVALLEKLGLLQYIIPEMKEGIGCKQNGDHIYEVWEHLLRAVQHSADRDWPLHVRLAALLHDVAKPRTRGWSDEKKDYTFYGHEVVGARMADKIMHRLKFPAKMADTVVKLVRHHMFFTDIELITLSAVRRIVRNVGSENVWDLMKVRACDRIGMGKPKEAPYRLRKYESMIEEAMRAPVSVGMLKIDGAKIIEITGEKPGPKLGWTLHALLEEVLDDPKKNTAEYLENRTKEFMELPEKELKKLGEAGKEAKAEEEEKELQIIRKKHGVK